MRKDLGPSTMFFPLPVLIVSAYDKDGKVAALNAAWGGVADSEKVVICLDEDHKTTQSIIHSKAMVVSFATAKYVVECDYLGIVSGNDEPKKIEKSGFHIIKSKHVNAPIIEELPLALECEIESITTIAENTVRIVGIIKNVNACECIMTEGKVDVKKLDPITYDTVRHKYTRLGDDVADAFSIGKKLK